MTQCRGRDVLTADVLLVANPISGSGAAQHWLQPVAERLRKDGARVEICRTGAPGDARKAAEGRAREMDLILVMGGDGTVREVLNGFEPDECCLGVLPAGTGNVLAGELGLTGHPMHDLDQLMAGRVVEMDMGLCNGERFAAVFGAGLDAEVVRRVEHRRQRYMSQLGYVPPLARMTLHLPQWTLDVQLDGAAPVAGGNLVVAGNTANYGGPVRFTPLADPCDGLFNVAMTDLRSFFDIPETTAAVLLRGTHARGRVRYSRTRELRVSSPARVPYQLDGDFAGWLPARVTCRPGALRIVAPRHFRRGRSR